MTRGASGGGGGPLLITSACRSIRPGEPSRRRNDTIGRAPSPSSRPTYLNVMRTFRCDIGSFLAENGSIEGGTTLILSGGTHEGANSFREKTNASAISRYGRR